MLFLNCGKYFSFSNVYVNSIKGLEFCLLVDV